MPKQPESEVTSMRLDKWLWCARFYKTRSYASEAIRQGRISVNGKRAKPSKLIQLNDLVQIRRGPFTYKIEIRLLSKGRKSASEAANLYIEEYDSQKKRIELQEQIKLNASLAPRTKGRPTKRDRREIIRFRNKAG